MPLREDPCGCRVGSDWAVVGQRQEALCAKEEVARMASALVREQLWQRSGVDISDGVVSLVE